MDGLSDTQSQSESTIKSKKSRNDSVLSVTSEKKDSGVRGRRPRCKFGVTTETSWTNQSGWALPRLLNAKATARAATKREVGFADSGH